MTSNNLPTVALIGRTNVGKSTLFNRMIEQSKALVSATAGTTRDRNDGECLWRGRTIRVVDTGGLDVNKQDEIEKNILIQSELAMKEADIILFVVDLKNPPLPTDLELASKLWKTKTPIIVVGNKAEKAAERRRAHQPDWRLRGLPAPIAVSATQGSGVGDLLDLVYEKLTEIGKHPVDYKELNATRVAVIGKPNVGKSTLLNALVGTDRFITSSIAHTTREPNDVLLHIGDKNYLIYDTAGMRKHAKISKGGGLEKMAVDKNEWVIRQSDVSLLVLDATEPIGTQEKHLAGILGDSGAGVIIIVNKWDLVKDKDTTTINDYKKYLAGELPFITWAPVMFVSALTKQRTSTIFKMIDEVNHNRSIEIDMKELDGFLREALRTHLPSLGKGKNPPKVMGLKQVSTKPPKFDLTLKAQRTDALHPSYLRFIENRLRVLHDFRGTPINIKVRIATAVSK
jgi:GTP-binding protein